MANELVMTPTSTAGGAMNLPPVMRQLLVLVAIAAAVALGVAAVLWSQEPNYGLLYGNLSDKDTTQVLDGLTKANIPYKIDAGTGALLVPAKQVHEARLKLASQGLPKGTSVGFELMDDKPAFGVSQLQETARYQRAIEGELARSIGTMANVQSARVHLAIPKQSAFIREQEQPRASVLINLYAGRALEAEQVSAVVHLVSASVPNLAPARVTVIDQKGRVLTTTDANKDLSQTSNQIEYKRRLETDYVRRIEEILSPVVGAGSVKAQVVTDLDFTITEETSERFNPERAPVRSEQTAEEISSSGTAPQGVPGALSNQPPAAASAPETLKTAAKVGAAAVAPVTAPVNTSKRATRNFEIDKTISHTKQPTGTIKRVTVAVVVDDIVNFDKKGKMLRKSRTPEDIERFNTLVKEAIGFDEKRGDRVNVVNAAFSVPPAAQPLPEVPLWKQEWTWDIAKQVGGAIAALMVLLLVVKPLLKGLMARPVGTAPMALAEDRVMLGGGATPQLGAPAQSYDQQVTNAKTLAGQDPRRVAQVVKNWVATDG